MDLLRLLVDNGGVNEEYDGGVNSILLQIVNVVVTEPGLKCDLVILPIRSIPTPCFHWSKAPAPIDFLATKVLSNAL